MSLRIRKDGRILCAAHSEPEPGDFYLDDRVHEYIMGCDDEDKQETKPLHWYDWDTHEYFINGGKPKTKNAIKVGEKRPPIVAGMLIIGQERK